MSTGAPAVAAGTTLAVAAVTSALRTVAGEAPGCRPRYRAAAPATCGEAIEVPLIVFVPPLSHVEVMLEPGAKMSRHEP
jgi:hypothetical protein